jgi:signal transduction histidine kinase/anti-sigma regulatory factor (Ser/Thr protein kinase)
VNDSNPAKFRPRARLLQLLGDQLIGSSRLAVFELVKNAYDADASEVTLTFLDLGTEHAKIIIRDDGEGMDSEIITGVWLEPGSDYREAQRRDKTRSRRFHRLPLGEKGVGRFAVHKLGTRIELRTRRAKKSELTVLIDWEKYAKHKYMDEAVISVEESLQPLFKSKETGTQIEISGLRSEWKKEDIRRLWRNVKSISSPAKTPESFRVELKVPQHEEWLTGLLDTPDFLDRAMWSFVFSYENGVFEWDYRFTPLPGIKLEPVKKQSEPSEALKLAPEHQRTFATVDANGKSIKRVTADEGFTLSTVAGVSKEQIGPVIGEFYAFDRDKPVLDLMPEAQSLTTFLDENGGVRVYRDGVRVYNYGERAAGDDWLGLDQRRVNIPTRRISNNIILGVIDISLEASGDSDIGLLEKTNREGFVENEAFEKFKAIVLGALIQFEGLREIDKDHIRQVLKTVPEKAIGDIAEPLSALRLELEKRKLTNQLGNHLKAIERKFNEMKEIMTHAGSAGLNLGILFHEIDRGVKGLTADIRRKAPTSQLLSRAEHLSELLDGFSTLLRKDKKKKQRIKSILQECKLLNESRFEIHDIVFSCPILTGEQRNFEVNVSLGMLLGALSNMIDNSIYWLQVRWPERESGRKKRAIYIGATDYFEEGPALVIADNGPGLPLEAADLVKPFVTMKPDGMGLGLYYVNLVCELNNARLVISPNREDVGIPRAYDGAAFAMVFNKLS